MGSEHKYEVETKSGNQKGCYISAVTAVLFVIIFAAAVVAVGLIVHFAETSGKIECNCLYSRETDVGQNLPLNSQNPMTRTECPENNCEVGALVSTHWLNRQLFRKEKLKTSCIQVLDISWVPGEPDFGYNVYLNGHIPSSQFYNYSECANSISDLPERECFESQMNRMGIMKGTHIILYDRYRRYMSVRMWWTFKLYGHSSVSILDGSIDKWTFDGYMNTTIVPSRDELGQFEINYNPDLIVHFSEVVNKIEFSNTQIVDARDRDEFLGSKKIGDLKEGHMPGAKNVQYVTLFNEDTTFKSPQELEQLFLNATVDLNKDMIVSCRTGVTATGLAVAAHLIGKNVAVYDGSWQEWSSLASDSLIVVG